MPLPILNVKSKHVERLHHGHPWVFSNELVQVPTDLAPGSLVQAVVEKAGSLGVGFYHPHNLVALRLLRLPAESQPGPRLSPDFFIARFRNAQGYREQAGLDTRACRLVFGESDELPGLILDRYGDYAVLELLSAGMDRHREEIAQAMKAVWPDLRGALLRHDSSLRRLEGLPEGPEEDLYGQTPAEIELSMEGLAWGLTLRGAQKTGFFLDQRENRLHVRGLSRGLRVLDLFSNQGGFALQAALGGAREVTGIDASAQAIAAAARNAARNAAALGGSKVEFAERDVFKFLEEAAARREKWDLIIVDPPAFAKTKKTAVSALHGYERLQGLAIRVLNHGGFLATGSCSMHVEEDRFFTAVSRAARAQQKRLVWMRRGEQGADHPVLAGMPETRYLKWGVFRVLPGM